MPLPQQVKFTRELRRFAETYKVTAAIATNANGLQLTLENQQQGTQSVPLSSALPQGPVSISSYGV